MISSPKVIALCLVALTMCTLFTNVFAESSHLKFVKETIEKYPVVIFSKSYCPFCRRAKALLDQNNIKYFAVELDQTPNGAQIQAALAEYTKQRTVPNIFIGQEHIGGSDDIHRIHAQGKLMEKVNAATRKSKNNNNNNNRSEL